MPTHVLYVLWNQCRFSLLKKETRLGEVKYPKCTQIHPLKIISLHEFLAMTEGKFEQEGISNWVEGQFGSLKGGDGVTQKPLQEYEV